MDASAATQVSPALITFYAVGGVIGAVLFWLLVCWLIARLGGWQRVAREFPARRAPRGLELRWRSVSLTPLANYNNCVRVVLCAQGVYAIPQWLFRFGHPPFLLPWANAEPPEEARFLGRRRRYLPVRAGNKTLRIDLPPKGWKWIEQHAR